MLRGTLAVGRAVGRVRHVTRAQVTTTPAPLAPRAAALVRHTSHSSVVGRVVRASTTAGQVSTRRMSIVEIGKKHPFWFQMVICTAKTSLCDILIQLYVEKKKQIDWQRNAVFIAFGSVYLGGFQYLLYSIWFPRWFPRAKAFANAPLRQQLKDKQGMKTLVNQVLLDNFGHNMFVYIPVFYMFKALIKKPAPVQNADGELVAPEPRSPLQIAKTALLTYKKNFVEDNYSMCALLIPGDILTFAAPMWLRMPANHLISFMWVCYLSFLRGAEDVAQ